MRLNKSEDDNRKTPFFYVPSILLHGNVVRIYPPEISL